MPKGEKITLSNGQVVDAEEVPFTIVREEWNEYKLADGGRVRVRLGVQKLFRVLDSTGKPTKNADGDPEVIVRSSQEVVASDR